VLREHPGAFTELVLHLDYEPDLDVAKVELAVTGGKHQRENGVPLMVRLKRTRTEPLIPVGP
jgi:hypothetical protein